MNQQQFLDRMKRRVRLEFDNQIEAARLFGCSQPTVSGVLHGRTDPTTEMLDWMGYRIVKKTTFIRVPKRSIDE